MDTAETIRRLPKLEQHIHIVGSTKPETLMGIIEDSGAKTQFNSIDDIKQFFQYRDFPHFISVYSTVNDCITDEKYYERITYEMLESDAASNVKHVEAIFSPNDHVRRGLDYGKMLDAVNKGIKRAKRKFGISCTIRVDLVRNYGPVTAMKELDWIKKKGDNVVAVDIGGSEDGFPPEPYEKVYKKAKDLGLHLVAHAGEAAGPESIWGAVKTLGVERIGHGSNRGKGPSPPQGDQEERDSDRDLPHQQPTDRGDKGAERASYQELHKAGHQGQRQQRRPTNVQHGHEQRVPPTQQPTRLLRRRTHEDKPRLDRDEFPPSEEEG